MSGRRARRRRYLMCRPEYFDVCYSINPWMDPRKPTSTELALAQWQDLHDLYTRLGHRVDLIDPVPGLPDMVFTANGATVIGRRALVARFLHQERVAEAGSFLAWFVARRFGDVRQAQHVNEGEGDYLPTASWVFAGTGFRSSRDSHGEVQETFGRPVISLELVDPRFYHLDTALAVLDGDEIMYYPPAFSPGSQAVLRELCPDAIVATDADAMVFGLNAVCDGLHVVLPEAATTLVAELRDRAYDPIGIDLSELLKAGGGVKCCTLELHEDPPRRPRASPAGTAPTDRRSHD